MAHSPGAAAITPSRDDPGTYYIAGQTWTVGTRYKLLRLLGEGSFSQVALAVDTENQEQVALKRIPDVLYSLENAKRVLREVCILRRMDHPGIIALRDVFLRPASTGRCVFRRGKLVPTSLDLYLALEYCDQGDLFHLRGQVGEAEVRSVMYQLLQALRYLHDNGVWHRDVKTANILVTYCDGARLVKIADLGSARSATFAGARGAASPPRAGRGSSSGGGAGARADGGASEAAAAIAAVSMDDGAPPGGGASRKRAAGAGSGGGGGGARAGPPAGDEPMRHNDSFMCDAPPSRSELFARPTVGGGAGFQSPLTRAVCTPCYRAPEVVMSRGVYSQAIDIWSAGCVFGELLQRVPWLGKAATPHLQVAPVFAMHGMPNTPASGERFTGSGHPAGNSVTRQELRALFQVIGTPSWSCIEGVPNAAWRNYLRAIPGRAPTLFRRFGAAGEVAVDLLQRLLTFDPARRPSCAEALAHEYFSALVADLKGREEAEEAEAAEYEEAVAAAEAEAAGAMVLDALEAAAVQQAAGGGAAGAAAEEQGPSPFAAPAPAPAAGGGGEEGGAPPDMEIDEGFGGGSSPLAKRARQHSSLAAAAPPQQQQQQQDQQASGELCPQVSFCSDLHGEHYYNIDDPAQALSKLEDEMGAILDLAEGGGDPAAASEATAAAASDAFRELLEREVSEHSQHLEARRQRSAAGAGPGPASAAASSPAAGGAAGARPGGGGAPASPPPPSGGARRPPLPSAAAVHRAAGGASGSVRIGRVDGWGHANPDPGQSVDPSILGMRRLPHHADAEQAHLEAEKHLKAGRHGEWTHEALNAGPKTGASWGVTLLPPGYSEGEHPDVADIIRSQNKR
ncbi:Map2 kinase [Raphidocelis subcapitata]|uniref:Map2 kinase n=1 Tax=Raphidocelis subcapitata TaxID=307507 RepID=A0A2V0NKW4_9CHLO|nr:Map2 kinase [Raphidocelis subcapitata]|eukprot:GBF88001.1 Map2 kinase [Raphidocelis subcapitata]